MTTVEQRQLSSVRTVSIVVPIGRVDNSTVRQLEAIGRLDVTDLDVELILSLNTGRTDDETALRDAVGPDFAHGLVIIDSSEHRGAAHARNAGAAVASGEVLAFCDADDIVEPTWLVRLVEVLDTHDAVSGRLVEHVDRPRDAGLRPPATPDALPTFLGIPYLLSGNLAIRATTFRALGGFDTGLLRCEDTALSWRLLEHGHTLGFAPDAVIHYRMRSGIGAMLRQQFMYGRGASQLLVRQGIPRGISAGESEHGRPHRPALFRANGQPGGRGSYIRVLRRSATAAGRLTGLVDEAVAAVRRRLRPPHIPVPNGHPAAPSDGERLLLVADAGGHLLEGTVIHQMLYSHLDTTWYTADTVMSRSLLRNAKVEFAARRVLPRRPDLALVEFVTALRLLRALRPDVVVSTGSAVALPWLAAAVLTGRRAIFHESAARVVAPSLTGRLIEHVPLLERYTQHPMRLPRRRATRWSHSRSTLELVDGTTSSIDRLPIRPRDTRSPRLFVTVGTYEYPFTRLFEQLESVVPSDWEIVWQVGHAGSYRPARGEVHDFLEYDRMLDTARSADLVITHAGIGSIMTVLQTGRLPTVVPRRRGHGEIADDHQLEVLDPLRAVGIVAFDDVEDITADFFDRPEGTDEDCGQTP